MIYIRDKEFNLNEYDKYFDDFSQLSIASFQKWAIKAIVDRDHTLISAPINTDNTLAAEFAIHHQFFSSIHPTINKKKIIYILPNSRLCYQKYQYLLNRFPHLSIGVITHKYTKLPDAELIIIPIKLFRNTLFNSKIDKQHIPSLYPFYLDLSTETSTIIFDGIHHISNPLIGPYWEQSIIMIPDNVQIILLSNIINKPCLLANWLSNQTCCLYKNIYLIPSNCPSMPLSHFLWLSSNSSTHKLFNDDHLKNNFCNFTNQLITIKDHHDPYYSANFHNVSLIQKTLYKNNLTPSYKNTLNSLISHIDHINLLPAICYCYSPDIANTYAHSINVNFNIDKTAIHNECEYILKSKIDNYKDFISSPEYNYYIKLLLKGVAVHHSNMLSILKELVEILFAKNYIKVLFATETLFEQTNIPTNTIIFSSLYKSSKSNNSRFRLLNSHEYSHISSRAGRPGYDSQGHVIICNSLFKPPSTTDLKYMLNGPPLNISSYFQIGCNFILNILSSNKLSSGNIIHFISKSILQADIDTDIKYFKSTIYTLKNDIEYKNIIIDKLKTPTNIFDEYMILVDILHLSNNNKRQSILSQIDNIKNKFPNIINDLPTYKSLLSLKNSLIYHDNALNKANTYIFNRIAKITDMLQTINFLDIDQNDIFILTERGSFASQITEINPLIITTFIKQYNIMDELYAPEIAGLLSCFTDISIDDDYQIVRPHTTSYHLNAASLKLQEISDNIKNFELNNHIVSSVDFNIHYNIQSAILDWCLADNNSQYKNIISSLNNSSISTSDFINAIHKICNIVRELSIACELTDHLPLCRKLKNIPDLLLKYVATQQSLYF